MYRHYRKSTYSKFYTYDFFGWWNLTILQDRRNTNNTNNILTSVNIESVYILIM